MTDAELEKLINKAAQAGATQALKEVGLSDKDAYDDVKELRGLLDSWRAAKSTVGKTIAQIFTTAVLTALSIGIWRGLGK